MVGSTPGKQIGAFCHFPPAPLAPTENDASDCCSGPPFHAPGAKMMGVQRTPSNGKSPDRNFVRNFGHPFSHRAHPQLEVHVPKLVQGTILVHAGV